MEPLQGSGGGGAANAEFRMKNEELACGLGLGADYFPNRSE